MDIQTLFDGMSAQWALERSKTMMTLGEMISTLSSLDGDMVVAIDDVDHGMVTPSGLMSYRGYYSDLAIDYCTECIEVTVGELRADLQKALGSTFEGYKGGDFVMTKITPMWVDGYSCARGIGISGIEVVDGKCVIRTYDTND